MGDKVTTAPAEKISPPAPEMAPAAPAAGFDAAAMDAKRTAAAEARKQEAADNAGKDPEKELDAGMASAAGTAAGVCAVPPWLVVFAPVAFCPAPPVNGANATEAGLNT